NGNTGRNAIVNMMNIEISDFNYQLLSVKGTNTKLVFFCQMTKVIHKLTCPQYMDFPTIYNRTFGQ
ncbi:hypothetical protein, partial [Elizabethkingia anophelis]|uniref:hypothetical protein n=1 Tax=Elizabethkingia anophelis TaxID=1117645 RepID=UPI001C8E1574